MTQPIAAQPSTPVRDPETASRVIERDTPKQAEFWSPGKDASFDEVLNSINPMHHIPVVSTIYRAVTGDTIGFGPRLIGAAILGGPVGLIIAGITAFIEELSGGTISEHVAALFEGPTGDDEPAPADVIAAIPGHSREGAGDGTQISAAIEMDASALGDAPTIQSPITETPIAAAWSGENPAAVAPVIRGVMSTAVPRQDVASIQVEGSQTKDSDSKRIAQTLLQAQRVQANLLLANLRANDAVKFRPREDENRRDGEEREPHSNLPPSGAGPIWYADAMQRALDKYRTGPTTPTNGL